MDINSLLSKDCRVIIDTCSMMHPKFKEALQKIVPILEKGGNKLIVPESCVKELRKHEQAPNHTSKALHAKAALIPLQTYGNN